jgi:hypothetical protein
MDPGLRRGDGMGRDDGKWLEALARFEQVNGEVEALVHCSNQRVYDRALGRHSTALRRLLRAPAPDLAAAGLKLELIVRHHVFEASFAEAAVASLSRDLRRFAAPVSSWSLLFLVASWPLCETTVAACGPAQVDVIRYRPERLFPLAGHLASTRKIR